MPSPNGIDCCHSIHPRTRSNLAGNVPLALQAFEYADNCSAGEPMLGGKVSRRGQSRSRCQTTLKYCAPQLSVEPTC